MDNNKTMYCYPSSQKKREVIATTTAVYRRFKSVSCIGLNVMLNIFTVRFIMAKIRLVSPDYKRLYSCGT